MYNKNQYNYIVLHIIKFIKNHSKAIQSDVNYIEAKVSVIINKDENISCLIVVLCTNGIIVSFGKN